MAGPPSKKEQELATQLQVRRTELQAIAEKIGEIESDADEHRLVLKTLSGVQEREPERTCFRLIGGVLVERTVKDVLPTLQTTYNGLTQVLVDLAKQYRQKESEMQQIQSELGA
ncbi:Cochaperone prefoldin complex subunit [Malassezia japonica]|uniref:Cochaperone prefoldin complex subunit n=1 Tax=Malassezia japonica TaxID=223818 RepID=A0AAF0F0B5_9BASI|nr:Cochaperone prefoldin complex subunit [Malassezia japonica]WFD38390.1 Cochaperone prefoldin complex subunit [Malassezia japonica]